MLKSLILSLVMTISVNCLSSESAFNSLINFPQENLNNATLVAINQLKQLDKDCEKLVFSNDEVVQSEHTKFYNITATCYGNRQSFNRMNIRASFTSTQLENGELILTVNDFSIQLINRSRGGMSVGNR